MSIISGVHGHLGRIKELEARLEALKKIFKRKEYLGAGVSFSIVVGAKNDESVPVEVDLGITANLDTLMETILREAEKSLEYNLAIAVTEYERLGTFLIEKGLIGIVKPVEEVRVTYKKEFDLAQGVIDDRKQAHRPGEPMDELFLIDLAKSCICGNGTIRKDRTREAAALLRLVSDHLFEQAK